MEPAAVVGDRILQLDNTYLPTLMKKAWEKVKADEKMRRREEEPPTEEEEEEEGGKSE